MARSNIRWKELFFLVRQDIKFEAEYAKRMFEKTGDEKYLSEHAIYSNLLAEIDGRKKFMTEN